MSISFAIWVLIYEVRWSAHMWNLGGTGRNMLDIWHMFGGFSDGVYLYREGQMIQRVERDTGSGKGYREWKGIHRRSRDTWKGRGYREGQ